jgi:hypothetical protein
MALATFLYPIVDSGYFFTLALLEVTKEKNPGNIFLKFRYSMRNTQSFLFQIPIKISHCAYRDCKQEGNFERNINQSLYSDRVIDLQSNRVMYGYGDDHYVVFQPNEEREFLVLFIPSETDFETFDIDFFMKPDDDDYGQYRLRYDFQSGQIIKRYCLRKYQKR